MQSLTQLLSVIDCSVISHLSSFYPFSHSICLKSPVFTILTCFWWADGPTNQLTDQQTNQQMDTPSYRDARTHLKTLERIATKWILKKAQSHRLISSQKHDFPQNLWVSETLHPLPKKMLPLHIFEKYQLMRVSICQIDVDDNIFH